MYIDNNFTDSSKVKTYALRINEYGQITKEELNTYKVVCLPQECP